MIKTINKLLFKIVIRTLLKNKAQTTVLFLLTFLFGLFYTYFDTSMLTCTQEQIEKDSQPEHFRFMISSPETTVDQLNAESKQIENKYGFSSEIVRKKFIQQDFSDKKRNFNIKMMPESINLPLFLTGIAPSSKGKIAVSRLFAEQNGIKPGSLIKLDQRDYTVSGIYVAPDEILYFDSTKPSYMSPETEAGILMLKEDFEEVNKEESIYFVGRYPNEHEQYIYNQLSNLSKESHILYATLSSEYHEVSTLPRLVNINKQILYFLLTSLFIILTVSLMVQISNQFINLQKPMGVFVGEMGIPKWSIALSYSIYFAFLSISLVSQEFYRLRSHRQVRRPRVFHLLRGNYSS